MNQPICHTGKLIREHMSICGCKQIDIARGLNKGQSTVSNWINGRHTLDVDEIYNIAMLFSSMGAGTTRDNIVDYVGAVRLDIIERRMQHGR